MGDAAVSIYYLCKKNLPARSARPHLDNPPRLRVTGPVQPATFRRFVNGGFFMLPTSLTGFEDQTRFFLSDRLFDNRRRLARGPQLDAAGQPLLWALSAVVLAACGTSGGGQGRRAWRR